MIDLITLFIGVLWVGAVMAIVLHVIVEHLEELGKNDK